MRTGRAGAGLRRKLDGEQPREHGGIDRLGEGQRHGVEVGGPVVRVGSGPVAIGGGSSGTSVVAGRPTVTVSRRSGSQGSVGRNCSVRGAKPGPGAGLGRDQAGVALRRILRPAGAGPVR